MTARAWVALLVAPVLLAAAGCGSDGGSDDARADGASDSDVAALVAEMEASVAELREPAPASPAGEPVDASKVQKGEYWYVSLSQEIPVLSIEQDGLKQAAAALGSTINICDSKFQPAVAASCINSAIDAGAVGIFTDAIQIDSVGTAATSAEKAGIPIVAISSIGTNSDAITYQTNGDQASHAAAAQWIIADSKGTAQVLHSRVKDDSGAVDDIESGSAPEFAKCSGCSVVFADYTAQTVPSVPSIVSSALLSNPDVDYGFPQFDFLVPLFKNGVQTAGFTDKMKIVSTNAVLSDMELVKSGEQAVDVGSNRNFSGWAAMDTMLRMSLDMPVDEVQVPVRIFDSTNIDSVELADGPAESGEWFGPLTYQDEFQKLWGL